MSRGNGFPLFRNPRAVMTQPPDPLAERQYNPQTNKRIAVAVEAIADHLAAIRALIETAAKREEK